MSADGNVRYIILPGAIRKDSRLTLAHLKVSMVLGAYSRNDSWTDLTQQDVGEMAGLSRETVCRSVGDLVEWGWVVRQKKAAINQYVYRFIMDRGDYCDPAVTVPNKTQKTPTTGCDEPTTYCDPAVTSTVTRGFTYKKEVFNLSSSTSEEVQKKDTNATKCESPAHFTTAEQVAERAKGSGQGIYDVERQGESFDRLEPRTRTPGFVASHQSAVAADGEPVARPSPSQPASAPVVGSNTDGQPLIDPMTLRRARMLTSRIEGLVAKAVTAASPQGAFVAAVCASVLAEYPGTSSEAVAAALTGSRRSCDTLRQALGRR